MRTKIFWLTSSYPYGIGEQFIENEIPAWAGYDVTLLPLSTAGERRPTGTVKLEQDCAVLDGGRKLSWKGICRVLTCGMFWQEITHHPHVLTSFSRLRYLYIFMHCALMLERALALKLRALPAKDRGGVLIYAYWFSWSAYAATRVRRLFPNIKIIARAHRGDLYHDANPFNYQPLSHRYHKEIDHIYAIAKHGKDYLERSYNIPSRKISVSRLGIRDHANLSCRAAEQKEINLLTVSYAKPVKRVHRLIDGIATMQRMDPAWTINWTHIGDGPLLEALKIHAIDCQVDVKWLGQLPNVEVHKYLESHPVDVFVNVSESEGLPVSIMEAVSFGVPVVATNVGGTSEIVDGQVGHIISANFTDEELANAIFAVVKKGLEAQAIKSVFRQRFCAETNYSVFVDDVLGRAAHDDL